MIQIKKNDWKHVKLSEIANITMGQSPPGSTYNTEKDGLPFFQGSKDFQFRKPKITMWCNQPKRIAEKDDILVSVRAPVGDINLAPIKCCIGRGNSAIRMKNGNQEFLYYLLKFTFDRVKRIYENEGTVFGSLKKSDLVSLDVAIPKNEEYWKVIGLILTTIDDKIELNQQMNEKLEQLAKVLFRSWFIEFEPFHDGEFEDTELGRIPKGWKVSELNEFVNIIMGQSPPGSSYNEDEEGMPFFQGVRDYGMRYPSKRVYTTKPKRLAKEGDVLVSVRAPVGSTNIALWDLCVGRGLAALRMENERNNFLYYLMMDIARRLQNTSSGTVFNAITKTNLENFKVIKPSMDIVSKFNDIIEPFDDKIRLNTLQTRKLTQLRNLLLPQLISGRIQIRESKKFLEMIHADAQ